MLARQGITLDRSTLSNWVGSACWWLRPLYDLVVATVLSSPKIFADDTSLPVLDPGRGRTKKGFLWAYAVDDRPWCGPTNPAVAYIYAEDRKNMRPAAHLAQFTGVLQVDGYDGFKRLASERVDQSVRLAFCWAHNLELVFMWSGGPTPSCWPETTAGGTPDNFRLCAACRRRVGERQRELLNLLRYLGNELRIPLACLGTREAYLAIRTDDQLENRFEPFFAAPLGGRPGVRSPARQLRGVVAATRTIRPGAAGDACDDIATLGRDDRRGGGIACRRDRSSTSGGPRADRHDCGGTGRVSTANRAPTPV